MTREQTDRACAAAHARNWAWMMARLEPIFHPPARVNGPKRVNEIAAFPTGPKRTNTLGAGRKRATLTGAEIVRRHAAGETYAQIAAAEGLGASTIGKIVGRDGLAKAQHRVKAGKA